MRESAARPSRRRRSLATATLASLLLLLGLELVLRAILGYPRGAFDFALPGEDGLYPASRTLEMLWGEIPYTVRTNALGFRGHEIARSKPPGTVRIVGLGDSITDGFFVDNEATYPALLERTLRAAGHAVEVVNAARGGGSIGKQLSILRELCLPLDPDVVVLTFVTNDIADIRGRSLDELLSHSIVAGRRQRSLRLRVITETALGEIAADRWFRMRLRGRYRAARAGMGSDSRYRIAGGDRYADNVEDFYARFGADDGMLLVESFSEETATLIRRYLAVLAAMERLCAEHSIRLVFVYFPAYPQVFVESTPMAIRDTLRASCERHAIPFLDLTPAFRAQGREAVLHLAPVDYHPNPRGNRLMAETVAGFLVDAGIVE